MIFRTEQTPDGHWIWRLRSTKLGRDIGECNSPTQSETECIERIALIKKGIPYAQVITSQDRPFSLGRE